MWLYFAIALALAGLLLAIILSGLILAVGKHVVLALGAPLAVVLGVNWYAHRRLKPKITEIDRANILVKLE